MFIKPDIFLLLLVVVTIGRAPLVGAEDNSSLFDDFSREDDRAKDHESVGNYGVAAPAESQSDPSAYMVNRAAQVVEQVRRLQQLHPHEDDSAAAEIPQPTESNLNEESLKDQIQQLGETPE